MPAAVYATETLQDAILRALSALPSPVDNASLENWVSQDLGLSDEDRSRPHPPRLEVTELCYRLAWARSALARAGRIVNVGRGLWALRLSSLTGHDDEPSNARSMDASEADIVTVVQELPPPATTPSESRRPIDIPNASPLQLLRGLRHITRELLARDVIRGAGAVVGDWAELLVAEATGGTLAKVAQESWDVKFEGMRSQVKARVIANPRVAGQRQLGIIRSWDERHPSAGFDVLDIVLLHDELRVWRALRVPTQLIGPYMRPNAHQRGHTLHANDATIKALLAAGADDTTTTLTSASFRLDVGFDGTASATAEGDWVSKQLPPDGAYVSGYSYSDFGADEQYVRYGPRDGALMRVKNPHVGRLDCFVTGPSGTTGVDPMTIVRHRNEMKQDP